MTYCPEPCGKIRFEREHTAILCAVRATMQGVPLIYYRSDECRCWHLSGSSFWNRGRRRRRLQRFLPESWHNDNGEKGGSP